MNQCTPLIHGSRLGHILLCITLFSCAEEPASKDLDPISCNDLCGPGTACVNGSCARLRGATTPTDGEIDQSSPSMELSDMYFEAFDQGSVAGEMVPMNDMMAVLDLGAFDEGGLGAELDMSIDMSIDDLESPCESRTERCDGIDNDCDELVDETDDRLTDFCPTGQLGACAEGRYICDTGILSCLANAIPSPELCDGVDNDCDGVVDDLVSRNDGQERCDSTESGQCAEGAWTCDLGEWICRSIRTPIAERCDLLDNDCDGAIDEAVQEVETSCETDGVGICGQGLWFCDQGVLRCSQTFPPTEELCDGLDNDCDGVSDEIFPEVDLPCFTEGLGVCGEGYWACPEGELICQQEIEQREERCDQRDDDCDGTIDEDFLELGSSCEVGVGTCAREGVLSCNDDSDYICVGESGEPDIEHCDGLDNDCDGEIDNLSEPPQAPEHCGACRQACVLAHAFPACLDSTCVVGVCHLGWVDLDGIDENGCEYACRRSAEGIESCDGLDNNCDGEIDGPEICVGDAFQWCRSRRNAGLHDTLCEDFSVHSFESEFWMPSTLGGGQDDSLMSDARIYKVLSAGEGVAGHNRRIPRISSSFALGLSLSFDSALVIAIGERKLGSSEPTLPLEDPETEEVSPPLPNDGLVGLQGLVISPDESWLGYGLWLWPNPLGGAPRLEVRSLPQQSLLWRGVASGLEQTGRHWLYWRHLSDGQMELSLDGDIISPSEQISSELLTELLPDELNEISLRLSELEIGQQSSEIDSLVVQEDVDHDDYIPPLDNCEFDFNPEQIDVDGNGFGSICDDTDEDGVENALDPCPLISNGLNVATAPAERLCEMNSTLLIGLDYKYNPGAWFFDFSSGQLSRAAKTSLQASGFTIGLNEALTWTQYNSVYSVSPTGEEELVAPRRVNADWIGTQLFYQDITHSSLYLKRHETQVNDPLVLSLEEGTTLTAQASSDESAIIVVTQSNEETLSLRFDAEGQPIGETIALPTQSLGDSLPYVDWLDTSTQLLVSGVSGEAQGVSLIHSETGILTPIIARPTIRARYLPNGDGFIAIHPELDHSHSLVVYLDFSGVEHLTLLDHSLSLRPDVLDWGGQLLALDNHDSDMIPDVWDACPLGQRRASQEPIILNLNDGYYKDLDLTWNGQELFASWVKPVSNRVEGRILRLSKEGEVLQDLSGLSNCRRCMPNLFPVWQVGQYQIPHLASSTRSSQDQGIYTIPLSLEGELSARRALMEPSELSASIRRLEAISNIFPLRLGLDESGVGKYWDFDHELSPQSPSPSNSGVLLSTRRDSRFKLVDSPDGAGAMVILNDSQYLTIHSENGNVTGPATIADAPFDALTIGDRVWTAFSSIDGTQLALRAFTLSTLSSDRPINVVMHAEQPSNPSLIFDGQRLGVFWLQTINQRRILFSRWLDLDSESWVTEPLMLSPSFQSIGTIEDHTATSVGVAWDGAAVNLLYTRSEGGLYFLRGASQCW